MAVIRQGGNNPHSGKVNTTMGLYEPRPPLCEKCHERKDQLYTKNVNGQTVCADCAGSAGRGVLLPIEEDIGLVATRDPDPQPSSSVPDLAIVPGMVELDLNGERPRVLGDDSGV